MWHAVTPSTGCKVKHPIVDDCCQSVCWSCSWLRAAKFERWVKGLCIWHLLEPYPWLLWEAQRGNMPWRMTGGACFVRFEWCCAVSFDKSIHKDLYGKDSWVSVLAKVINVFCEAKIGQWVMSVLWGIAVLTAQALIRQRLHGGTFENVL